jgi:hypothetical protein
VPLFMVQIWYFPDRWLENAILVPSGDQVGPWSSPAENVRRLLV